MSECVSDVCECGGEAGGGGRSGAALKTKTPHANVGKKKVHIYIYLPKAFQPGQVMNLSFNHKHGV